MHVRCDMDPARDALSYQKESLIEWLLHGRSRRSCCDNTSVWLCEPGIVNPHRFHWLVVILAMSFFLTILYIVPFE